MDLVDNYHYFRVLIRPQYGVNIASSFASNLFKLLQTEFLLEYYKRKCICKGKVEVTAWKEQSTSKKEGRKNKS